MMAQNSRTSAEQTEGRCSLICGGDHSPAVPAFLIKGYRIVSVALFLKQLPTNVEKLLEILVLTQLLLPFISFIKNGQARRGDFMNCAGLMRANTWQKVTKEGEFVLSHVEEDSLSWNGSTVAGL